MKEIPIIVSLSLMPISEDLSKVEIKRIEDSAKRFREELDRKELLLINPVSNSHILCD